MATHDSSVSRRSILHSIAFSTATLLAPPPPPALADSVPLDSCLYTILRVREGTQQETRLIGSGKFKDVQRANVKLAVRFLVNNYRLADTFIAASAFLDDTSRRVKAGELGQAAVQNLYTILEYFDASDVQNLKVGTFDNMAGKEELVLKGLEATRQNIDDFLAFFPTDKVETARNRIVQENDLNLKEWDPSLGDIVNLPPAV